MPAPNHEHIWLSVPGVRDDPNVHIVCGVCGIHQWPKLVLANGEDLSKDHTRPTLSYPFGTS